MEQKELVCVNCPKGCRITVELEDGKVQAIRGYSCDKGKQYAAQETTRPMRILTTTARIEGARLRVLPVITDKEIPLDQMSEAMNQVRKITVQAPIKVNDVIIADFLGTDANLVASRSMEKQS